MNVLVTGGAGYIGSICCEILLSHGFRTIVADNLSEGHRAAIPAEAIFYQVDLKDRAGLDEIFRRHRIDAVMHFAGEALVGESMLEPTRFYLSNVAHGIVLLDSMVRHGVKSLVFSSTCSVYGEPDVVPINEDSHKRPINPYGKSKLVFEQILEDYRSYTGLDFVSLRYFNAAGASRKRGEAHRKETHLVPRALDVATGRVSHVDVFGSDYSTHDGTCIRDYIHVLDIAFAHVCALEAIGRVGGRAFNIGTGFGHSVSEVIETVRRVTGCVIREKRAPRRAGDPAVLVAGGDKLQRELGWTPKHSSLDEIISSAWTWKQKYPNGYE